MSINRSSPRAALPSVDRLLRHDVAAVLIAEYGRPAVTGAIRGVLDQARTGLGTNGAAAVPGEAVLLDQVSRRLDSGAQPSLRAVFNLTGTVLHTNLGRAALPEAAIEAVAAVARGASNLEYDLATGRRGDRDAHLEDRLCRLTGAEAATVVNNNAGAVLLALTALATLQGLRRRRSTASPPRRQI